MLSIKDMHVEVDGKPVLKGLTTKLDGSTLKAVDGLFELFVVADQKELPGLTINASFVDQEVWKEAAKFIGRHGIEYLSGIKKILGSKNPSAAIPCRWWSTGTRIAVSSRAGPRTAYLSTTCRCRC